LKCIIRSFVWDLSVFLMQAFIAIVIPHRFWEVAFH
jgi:hypothetical protein